MEALRPCSADLFELRRFVRPNGSHDQYSDPQSAHGPEISVAGKRDPKKPEVLSAQYEVIEPSGYTVTVTWKLRQKY